MAVARGVWFIIFLSVCAGTDIFFPCPQPVLVWHTVWCRGTW